MGNTLTSSSPGNHQSREKPPNPREPHTDSNHATSPENSRVLFLLYLIHRTWNVVVDSRGKRRRTRLSGTSSEDSGAPRSYFDETSFNECDTDLDEQSSLYGSQYSFCSCSYCYDAKRSGFYSRSDMRLSICESEISSFCIGYEMAPSTCQSTQPPGSQVVSLSMAADCHWPQKENQRPPVYNPEDYVQSLKKYGKRQSSNNLKSIYDTTENECLHEEMFKSTTLPSKYSEYKSPIPSPPEKDNEMSLRQFGSITDLLTKLRADLRASFPSFVQEFVSSPLDGVSLLLEVLRAIQLSQTITPNAQSNGTQTMPRNNHSYQRRALLDELASLQCLSVCCSRSPEAGTRLGSSPVGLLPLAASATGQGIRSRILALQLLTVACDKEAVGHAPKNVSKGHTAVSDAVSTLRLRCGEPVRFRLLVGMLNSGGGTGELQAVGVRFLNTFLESAENLQSRLYLQAELFQAGFDPANMTKSIASSSPWLDKLRSEIKRFDELKIDIERLQMQARDSERSRSQMVILERRVQILQEEKTVLTSMERRLQERCADLQREIFRLQGVQSENFKSLDKRPIALPRHIPPNRKQGSSEHEDEGISSSETGPSLSPEPILVLPQNREISQKFNIVMNGSTEFEQKDDDNTTIEEVIEELENIVSNAEKEILPMGDCEPKEKEIVPVNLLPQPPRKTRSLAHLLSHGGGSDLDASEYGMLLLQQNHSRNSFFDDVEYDKPYAHRQRLPEETENPQINSSTNREILDAIMNARQAEEDPTMKAWRAAAACEQKITPTAPETPAQHFNGVFFRTEMSTPQKYPKPDVTAALQARRVSKHLERVEAYGLDSVVDVVEKSRSNQQIFFGGSPTLRINSGFSSFTNNVTIINNSTRTRSYTQGSKVTEIPSGMY